MQLGTILGTAFGFCLPPALLFVGLMVFDQGGRLYTIDPILSPPRLPNALPDRDGVAASLRTEVSRLVREARSDVAIRPNMPGDAVSQIRITGTDLTLDTLRSFARAALGRHDVRITGELSEIGDTPTGAEAKCFGGGLDRTIAPKTRSTQYRLVLKDSERGLVFDCAGTYDDLVRNGGLAVFADTDPFSAATLLAKRDPEHNIGAAFLLAETARADGERKAGGLSVAGRLCATWPNYDVPRAHLTLGNLHLVRGRLKEAEKAFTAANAEFARIDCRGEDWYAAQDALALVALSRARSFGDGPDRGTEVARGRGLAERALVLNDRFDGAMYRKAESFDIESERKPQTGGQVDCGTVASLRQAIGGYRDLVAKHPGYAGGYEKLGGIVVRRLKVLDQEASRPGDEKSCFGEFSGRAQETMDLLVTGAFAFTILAATDPDKHPGDGDFWPLLATTGFDRAFPADGARLTCTGDDDDWLDLVGSAHAHYTKSGGGEAADAATRPWLDRVRAAQAMFARVEDDDSSAKATRLRELARTLPEGEERRRVERAAGDLVACGARNPNTHASR